MPAAAAQRITARPALSLLLTVVIGLVVVWVGVGVAFYTDEPVGFVTTSVAFGIYVLTHVGVLARSASRLAPALRARAA
jgi:zinc/manganese transport system permease protein